MQHHDAQLVHAGGDTLGECPVWDPVRSELLWTDVEGRCLHRLPDGATTPVSLRLERRLASFAVTDAGGLLAAFDAGLALLDRDTGECEWLGDIEADRPETRSNDGQPDRNGNFVFGTMVEPGSGAAGLGNFYHWNAGRGLTHLYRSARIANGLCFGVDGLSVHYADSVKGVLWRARYHPQHALFIEDEILLDAGVVPGAPDGATVDADGNVWNARWGGSGVVCISPTGEPIAFVDVPVPHVSSCCFGGPDLDRLYITTARQGLELDDPSYESSGSLWVARPGVVGIAATPIATGRRRVP